MTITPDDKDWTWVLERPCPECNFDAGAFDVTTTGSAIRSNAETWRRLLAAPAPEMRARDDRWSTLEYACHVRDVLRVYATRLDRMLTEDGPHYENWDQDATASEDQYGDQSPAQVAGELTAAGEALATSFDTVRGSDWARTGFRSDGAVFTVESFARYFIHDPIHHIWDVSGS